MVYQPRGDFMIKDFKDHFWHYLVLVLIISIGGLVFILDTNKVIKFQIGTLVAIAYVFWGIIHHFLEKNLNFKIMVEYLLIGALSVALLGGVLL